jgi:cation diffusion facilitator CzcD-associated flavoprotein CzcO
MSPTTSEVRERLVTLARRRPRPLAPGVTPPRVAIIGSGFGGLGMAIRLRQAGIDTVTIFEKADTVGGTWRDNTYPGAACDVPSHLYSLSFAPNPEWTRKFPEQSEIQDYLERTADDFDVRRLVRFGTEVTALSFAEDAGWTVTLADGSEEVFDVVVAATGQLSRPYVPPIEGLDTFDGRAFHSARWDHDHDLTGRDVAVIGCGASAIQFVPAIADQVRSLTLFQRSVNYVAPKPDGPIGPGTRELLRRWEPLRLAYRASIWARFEWRFTIMKQGSLLGRLGRERFQQTIARFATDDLPAEAIVPQDELGCRRILIANDWYPTLRQPHVHVVTDPVDRIEPDAVVAGGERHPVDTLVFGTGFRSTEFLGRIEVAGRDGRRLADEWVDGAEAHLGITVTGFPNLFLLYGPNTNLGHNSIVFMLERQIGYVVRCLTDMAERGVRWRDVRPQVQAASNARLEEELSHTVWAGSCHNWYRNAAGKITNNWSSYTWKYWLRTRRPRFEEFADGPRRGAVAPPVASSPDPGPPVDEREPAGV